MRRRTSLLLVVVPALAMASVGLIGPTAQAQGENTIHIVLEGGGAPGTYDITTSEPCRPDESGPGDWMIEVNDPAAAPASLSVTLNAQAPEWNYLVLRFADGASYQSADPAQTVATVDDRGGSATLTLAAEGMFSSDAQGTSVPGGSAVVTIECNVIQRLYGEATPTLGIPTAGEWTGTVTVTATIDYHKAEQGSSQDPGSTYYHTWTTDDRLQASVTDTFGVVASDPADVTYGIHQVDLDGTADAAGSMVLRWHTSWEKQNSGCTWHQDNGTEQEGSWTATGRTSGSLRFAEDGSYVMDIRADTTGPGGASAPNPKLPQRTYELISDLSANCEGEGYDRTTDEDTILVWATRYLGERTTDGLLADIHGQLDPANPGAVVAGTQSWTIDDWGGGVTLTADWHLEHDGPITLPHG